MQGSSLCFLRRAFPSLSPRPSRHVCPALFVTSAPQSSSPNEIGGPYTAFNLAHQGQRNHSRIYITPSHAKYHLTGYLGTLLVIALSHSVGMRLRTLFDNLILAGENEKLTLTLNEAAAPSRPVVLEYSELLVNKPTEPGTHTLKVNESAVLHPIDGNGVAGEAYEFPVPTVDYTVAKPDPAPQPGATDKPSDNGAATDKPGAKTALAKTGDEAFAIGMGCLLVAGASACVIATALKHRRN